MPLYKFTQLLTLALAKLMSFNFFSLFKYHLRHIKDHAEHDYVNVYCKFLRDLNKLGIISLKNKVLLDLGCGQRLPISILAASDGAIVTAIDINYSNPNNPMDTLVKSFKYNGPKRALKSFLRQILFDKTYFSELKKYKSFILKDLYFSIRHIIHDPKSSNYPVESDTFDIIVSIAVLEHVTDVNQFASEVKRLLKNGGIFYGIIHNFYSISGGHRMEWAYPDLETPKNIEPWDHLRKNKYPSHVFLNKLLPEQYFNIFNNVLKVIKFEGIDINHDPSKLEGEKFLTPEVYDELKIYPKEILLTRSYLLIAKK